MFVLKKKTDRKRKKQLFWIFPLIKPLYTFIELGGFYSSIASSSLSVFVHFIDSSLFSVHFFLLSLLLFRRFSKHFYSSRYTIMAVLISSSSFSVIFFYSFLFFINSTPFTIILFASTDPSVSPSSSSSSSPVSDFETVSFPSYVSVENDYLYTLVEELNFMGGQISRAANRCLRSSKSLTPTRMQTTERVLKSFTDVLEDWEIIFRENQEVQDLLEDSSSSSIIMEESSLSYAQSAYLSVKKVLERSRNVQNQLGSLENVEFPSIDVLDNLQIGIRDLGLSMDRLRFVVFIEKEGGGEEEEERQETETVEDDDFHREDINAEGGGEEERRETEMVEDDDDYFHQVDLSAEGLELSQFVWEGMSTWSRSSDFVSDEGDVSRKKEVELIAEKVCEIVDTGRFSEHAINSKGRGLSSVRGVSSMMEDVVSSGEELERSLMYLLNDEDDVLTAVELRNALKNAETFLENVFLFRNYVESSLHAERTDLWRQRRSSSGDDDDIVVQKEKDNIILLSSALRLKWKEQIQMTKGVEALNRIVVSAREVERQLEKAMNSEEQMLIRNGLFDVFSGMFVLEELERNAQNLGRRMKDFVLQTPWLFDNYDESINDNVEDENAEGEAMMMKESVDRLNKMANAFSDFELTERKKNRENIDRNVFSSSSVTTLGKGVRPLPPSLLDSTSQFDLTRELQYIVQQKQKQQTNHSSLSVRTNNRFLSLKEV